MGAFATEIFRGGIISIDKGQWQASRALGMTSGELMRHIILPQATKRMIPPFVNQSIIQLKNTSLLYVVAIPDLMYTGSIIVSDTFRPLEVYTSVAIAYFVILYPLTLWAARWRRALTSSGEVMVEVEGLRKSYGTVEAVRGVSLEVHRGQVVVRDRPVGLRQVDFPALHQSARRAVGRHAAGRRPHDRFRRASAPRRAAATWRASAPASAWCSSSSTSSRT